MLNIKYQHSWLHCTSRKDIFLYKTQICKTSEHSATGKSLPHLWHTAQHSIHTQHRKYRIHQEYSTQHKIYHVYIRNTAGRDLCFAVGQAQARPHPPFKRGFLPWICSQCVSIVCHVIFNTLFIEECFTQTFDGYWIFTTRQITVMCLECDWSWTYNWFQTSALSSTGNHEGNSSELMAHLVLSSDDCSRYCSLPLSSPRYDYQIWSCRNDLHPGPFDLCRLSARMANSTYSWKKNQGDSQSPWI